MLVSLVWKGVEKQQAPDYDDGGAARRLGGRSAKLKRLFRRRWYRGYRGYYRGYRGYRLYSRGTRQWKPEIGSGAAHGAKYQAPPANRDTRPKKDFTGENYCCQVTSLPRLRYKVSHSHQVWWVSHYVVSSMMIHHVLFIIKYRPERWIVTIPSSDQWLATIENH